YKAHPATLEEALETILTFGVLTDAQEEARRLVAGMRDDIRRVTEAAARIPEEEKAKVYFEIAPGWTVGKGEYLDELIRLAGGINVAGDAEGWTMINEEHIIAQDPDVILHVAGLVDHESGKTLEELIRSRPGWEKVKAVRENRLVGLDEDVVSRTGPRITEALLLIAEAIYPGMVRP
ncbi:ABC transporter substrate-binding protein, partial [Parageobacillus thermoglucosidasius]|uniref:ABC transporter substrate-binding protein n=1 Tax=Parageobacillus thermoglucosidasius TaxID=1426 RepID=UPI00241FC077